MATSDDSPSEELRSPEAAKPDNAAEGACIECGATTEIFEDAAKWQALRDKRREYMRRRRESKQ